MSWPKTAGQQHFVDQANALAGPIARRAAVIDRTGEFPYESFDEMHRAGYLALTIPERLGGGGADLLEYALAQERIAHACGSTGLASSMHLSLVGRIGETRLWPDDVYDGIARDVFDRGALINAANSEPDMGSPSRGALPSTTATRTPNGWRVDGRKRWASLAPALSWVFSLVTLIDDDPPRRGNVLIPMAAPGIRVIETWDNLGMRATASHDIVFDGVEVPYGALLPAESSAEPGDGQAWFTIPGGAVYLGIGLAARDAAVEFARTRQPNGMSGPIAELQTIQHKIAEIDLLLLQARTLLYSTAEDWLAFPEERSEMGWRLAAAKMTVTRHVLRATELALSVTGSAGMAADSPMQRFFRDARTATGHPPMEDAVLTMVGKQALGLPTPVAEPVASVRSPEPALR